MPNDIIRLDNFQVGTELGISPWWQWVCVCVCVCVCVRVKTTGSECWLLSVRATNNPGVFQQVERKHSKFMIRLLFSFNFIYQTMIDWCIFHWIFHWLTLHDYFVRFENEYFWRVLSVWSLNGLIDVLAVWQPVEVMWLMSNASKIT